MIETSALKSPYESEQQEKSSAKTKLSSYKSNDALKLSDLHQQEAINKEPKHWLLHRCGSREIVEQIMESHEIPANDKTKNDRNVKNIIWKFKH